MKRAKLIVLNGFAAAGKTTIAKKYIQDHDMALALEVDALVDNIGDWIHHEDEVRQLTFDMAKAILKVYLTSGNDVVLPYLITSVEEAEDFESIAKASNADYYEFVLHNERADAIARLFERGSWGEATSPPLTEEDLPDIEKLIDKMESAIDRRPDAVKIHLKGDAPDATYRKILAAVE